VNGRRTDIVARVDGRAHPDVNDLVYLHPSQNHTHVFDVESGERISQAVAS
jgi:multiple sugar transport system ATP-binding protein